MNRNLNHAQSNWQSLFFGALFALTACFSTNLWAHNSAMDHARVTAKTLNVRGGPGTGFARIGALKRGDIVQILSKRAGWYKIHGFRGSGWVSGTHVSLRGRTGHSHKRHLHQPRGRYAQIGPTRYGLASVFEGPGPEFNLVTELPVGERVRIFEYGRKWTRVGRAGVFKGYVDTVVLVDPGT